ncbi:DNA ligase 3-like [Corticium candelabrum]|uniref:DNA ligase 3-like n=1 Tax=Corticium candelabrum TaxID=121492 RepID=UPI002E275002|nr:DNA ligase 3-like [Corticium candelabrum]
MSDPLFSIEYATTGRSSCKKCKTKVDKGVLRIARMTANPFSEGEMMKAWYHAPCLFDALKRARAATRKVEGTDDLEGFDVISEDDKEDVRRMIEELSSTVKAKSTAKPKNTVQASLTAPKGSRQLTVAAGSTGASSSSHPSKSFGARDDDDDEMKKRDNSFRQMRKLCEDIEAESSTKAKTQLLANYIAKGNSGEGFTGDLYLLIKLLLPGSVKRVYNIQSKQIIKLFSVIFGCNQDDMTEDLEQGGEVSDTVSKFFEQKSSLVPSKRSTLSLAEVDQLLESLSEVTKEDEQETVLKQIAQRSTAMDLKYIVRLIKRDLRMNAGARCILDALDSNAYAAFQTSSNLRDVVDRLLAKRQSSASSDTPSLTRGLSVKISLMTPVKPMLAEACKSFGMAMKKCSSGMYAEIKYDGERVQVHKKGSEFAFYSRSLKPVLQHKVQHVKDFLPQACPHGKNMIFDSEVLLVDTKTGNPLPFGTLGIHKKSAFKDASVCLFVFDCLFFNDESLLDRPMQERRNILERNLTEIPNRIVLSEQQMIKEESDLSDLMMRVIRDGLEGLVLKDVKGIYEPGKRHWLKMKKDYLAGGTMADTADLVVLGAYFGTGSKGGMMSVFLMGVYDKSCQKWRTVCKCGNGHDDATLIRLQKELKMVKIGKDFSKVPSWLLVNRSLTPDLVSADPKQSPVWEITGAEFSKSTTHTASNISIRFPRVTRIRDDKDWATATNIDELKVLVSRSKESVSLPSVTQTEKMDDDVDDSAVSESKAVNRKRSGASSKSYVSPAKKVKPSVELPEKDLPCVFSGMTFYVPTSVDRYSELKRYITAYDGDVVEEFNKSTATHIVCTPDEGDDESSTGQESISAEWLWKCIKKKKLVRQ